MTINKTPRINRAYKYFVAVLVFLIFINAALGVIITKYAGERMKNLINSRMLDISNTAADMLDGDVLRKVTPEDKGTPEYESVMKTLTYFQNNIDLKYIYCIRDKGKDYKEAERFVFGLDPTVEDPGEFGSPIVFTDALNKASKGTSSVDGTAYKDSWGEFYSAYSPVFDSEGKVGGIVAVDFSKDWYDEQIAAMLRMTLYLSIISLVIGGALAMLITRRSLKRIRLVNEQVNELSDTFETLMWKIRNMTGSDSSVSKKQNVKTKSEAEDIDSLKMKIADIQDELRSQIIKIHEQVYIDDTTGVMNKACYINTRNRIEASIGGDNSDFSIIVCDMNGLKAINDTLGHEIGDVALKDIANVLISVFGQKNIYRIGGDEFIVISEEISENAIKEDFDKVGAALSSMNTDNKPYRRSLSISMGYAVYQKENDKNFADVFRRADQMMYSNKSAYYMRHGDRRRKQ